MVKNYLMLYVIMQLVVDGDDIYVIGGDNGNKVIRCRNGHGRIY